MRAKRVADKTANTSGEATAETSAVPHAKRPATRRKRKAVTSP